jgi:undecaprenyl-diphosphatase
VLAALALRRPGVFPLVVLGVLVADTLAFALKYVFSDERPYVRYPEPEPLVEPSIDLTFPSGHSATSFAGAALLAAAVPRLAAPLYALAGAIAFSRVYVGVHYPLDILAGAALGLGVARALPPLVRALRRSLPERRAS